jgi:hypothetical protein
VVSTQKAEEYDPNDFDEETCPRCNGSGPDRPGQGRMQALQGNGFVTEAKAAAYRNKYQ